VRGRMEAGDSFRNDKRSPLIDVYDNEKGIYF